MSSNTYATSGVDTEKEDLAMSLIRPLFKKTFQFNHDLITNIELDDHYAAVVKVSDEVGIAIKTDGVGTKTFVAQYMDKYDTVGIDCIAMNVNDIICVGAKPTTFIDYLALQNSDPELIHEIAKGLKIGADMAKVSIVGGETAIMPEMITGVRDGKGFDLAGCALGIVNPDEVIDGKRIEEGDSLIGISSSGIHSNGMTLARKVLDLEKNFDRYYNELDRTLGEELLEPTSIYVNEILDLISAKISLKVVAHITSDGLLNLRRIGNNFGYRITSLPKPQPIYKIIQNAHKTDISEMYKVYNMGIGMCVVVPKKQEDMSVDIVEKHGKKAFRLGEARFDQDRRIILEELDLISEGDKFIKRY